MNRPSWRASMIRTACGTDTGQITPNAIAWPNTPQQCATSHWPRQRERAPSARHSARLKRPRAGARGGRRGGRSDGKGGRVVEPPAQPRCRSSTRMPRGHLDANGKGEGAMIDVDAMRQGMAAGEFFLEYCPIVSLANGACLGGEALVRWRRPAGLVMPDEFIPIAENTPLSGELCYWVIETAASELGTWLRDNPTLSLSINVPPEILGRGGIRYAADKCGLTSVFSQLILEITERGVPDLIGINALEDYASWGMRIAIDDVSRVGGANLALLSRAPLSVIKLDRSLIAQINPQSPRPDWLEGVSSMIQSTQLTVIAEGVETEPQALAMRGAGIQAAQGFFFSRPVGAASLMAFCREASAALPTAAPW